MAQSSKPVLLHRCRHCSSDLALSSLNPPHLGLLKVVCGRCHHEHLFSPHELELAQIQSQQVAAMPPVGIPRLIHSLRRVLSA